MNQWINEQFCGWLSLNQPYTNRYHHTLFYYSIYLSLHISAVLSSSFCENGRMVVPSGWILDNLNTQIQQGWPSQKLLNWMALTCAYFTALNRTFCQCPTCFTKSLPFTGLTYVVWRCFSLGVVKADYLNSLWINDRWPESFWIGLEPSAKARRCSEQSCRGRWFLGGAKNTTTQMEIVAPKCLLNSKEYILKMPI